MLIAQVRLVLLPYLLHRCKQCALLHSRFSDGQCKNLRAPCALPSRWWRSCGQQYLSPRCLKDKAGCLNNVYNVNTLVFTDQTSVEGQLLQCSPSLNQLTSCGRAGAKEHCRVRLLPSVTHVGGKVFKKWASSSRFKPPREKAKHSNFPFCRPRCAFFLVVLIILCRLVGANVSFCQ